MTATPTWAAARSNYLASSSSCAARVTFEESTTSAGSFSRSTTARPSCSGTWLGSNSGLTSGAAITELNGEGEVASGIALQRSGSNALDVIDSVKRRIAELMPSLPAGTKIVPVYDRSNLIDSAIETLKHTLFEESVVVALVCIVFLLHIRSALVAILMLPVGILMAFGAMRLMGLGANIMSLGGIAIAIGAMIDGAIVMIENAHKHLERADPGKPRAEAIIEAAREVGPALFFSLLIITVSFMPIFTLESQEGRLFGPLAFTKTFSMAAAAILSITLVPVLMILFVRGRIVPEHKNPINRALIWLYRPLIRGVLRAKTLTILLALAALGASAWPAGRLGTEFMPTLDEGTLLFMPTTLPGISITSASQLLQTQDRIIKGFPEVASVYGKAGRSDTSTDPAPSEMFETVVNLKPKDQWRPGVTMDGLVAEMDKALQFPGVSNAWTMPIKARTDMLATGIRTPVGIKVLGRDLGDMEKVAREIETVVRNVPGATSAPTPSVSSGATTSTSCRTGTRLRGTVSWSAIFRTPSPWRSAVTPSPPPSRGVSATPSTSATPATCAATRGRSPATSWSRCRAAARCRSATSPR